MLDSCPSRAGPSTGTRLLLLLRIRGSDRGLVGQAKRGTSVCLAQVRGDVQQADSEVRSPLGQLLRGHPGRGTGSSPFLANTERNKRTTSSAVVFLRAGLHDRCRSCGSIED